MAAKDKPQSLFWLLVHSFSLKLLLLAVILLSVPLILYWQFQRAESEQSGLLRNAADQTGRVIAAMLRPHFVHFSQERPAELREALAGAAIDNNSVKVLVRLAGAKPDDFLYIASAPPLSANDLERERRELVQAGIFQRLAPTCDRVTDLQVRIINPAGRPEILSSMTPVHAGGNCWIVITAQNVAELAPTTLHLPFLQTPVMRDAAAIYLLSVALLVWLFAQMWRNVSRFRSAARRISMRGAGSISFRELNSIPELTRVADDFDSLVGALTASQALIKQTAEESTHALKAPLAVIAQSIEPLRRAAAASDATAQRSLQLIERSVARLDSLVTSARDIEQAAAEVVYPVRGPVNISGFLAQMLHDYEVALASQDKHMRISSHPGIVADANEDLLEPVIENLLENAASYTDKGGAIEVRLERDGEWARICVADRGPGVAPDRLPHIFERYVSYREETGSNAGDTLATECHQGLGLWIVKRNIEGLGGTVTARNREPKGFEVTISLRAST